MNLADTIAAAIGARRSGGWWRTTTAHCHGGDTADGLAFRSVDDKLIVRCFTNGCHETLEGLNRARDKLRAAAGLPAWQPSGTGQIATHGGPGRGRAGHKTTQGSPGPKRVQMAPEQRTADCAAKLWTAAAVSTGQAPEYHPVSRWLESKAEGGLWPADKPLPEAVRWLPRKRMPRGRPESQAAGAVVLAMRRLDAPLADPRKVHLVAIDAQGRKAQHWPGKRGDKRTFGTNASAFGLLARDIDGDQIIDLHVCEGLADGLRVLRYAQEPAVVAVCAGTGYGKIEPGWFGAVTLWPDADEAGMRTARWAAQKWANQGYQVQIRKLPAGHDPASAPLTE